MFASSPDWREICLFFQYIGSFQKKYSIKSFDLLKQTAPLQAMSLLFLGPFIDYILNGQNILEYSFSAGSIVSNNTQTKNAKKAIEKHFWFSKFYWENIMFSFSALVSFWHSGLYRFL